MKSLPSFCSTLLRTYCFTLKASSSPRSTHKILAKTLVLFQTQRLFLGQLLSLRSPHQPVTQAWYLPCTLTWQNLKISPFSISDYQPAQPTAPTSLRDGCPSLCVLCDGIPLAHQWLAPGGIWADELGQPHSLSQEVGLEYRDTSQHLLALRSFWLCAQRGREHPPGERWEGSGAERQTEWIRAEMSGDLFVAQSDGESKPCSWWFSSSWCQTSGGFISFPALGYHDLI